MVWIGLGGYYYDYYPDNLGQNGAEMTYLGASYGLGSENKYGTLAMFLHHYGMPLNPFPQNAWPGSGVFDWTLDSKWTIMWAYPMEKLSFGLYFNRSDNGYKHEEEAIEDSYDNHYAYTTIGASVRFDIGEKAYADLGFDLSLASYKDENTSYGDISDNSRMMMGVKGRMFYQWNETITWVPFVNFRNFDFSLKADSADYVDDHWGDKGMMFDLGIGANIKVNEDNMLIFAMEPFSYWKREPSEPPAGVSAEWKATVMPRFFLALESDVKDWLTFRAGAYKEFVKEEMKQEVTDEGKNFNTSIYSDYDFFMGLGFHVGDFDIDAVVNNSLPFRLGYWLTGFQPDYYNEGWENAPVYMITGTYHF